MSILQADCFRTKEGERKAFQNIPGTVKDFGLAKVIRDTNTVAHDSFFVSKIFLTLSAIHVINSIHFSRYNSNSCN